MNWAGMRRSAGASSAAGWAPCRSAGTSAAPAAECPLLLLLLLLRLRRSARALCSSAIASSWAPAECPSAVTWRTRAGTQVSSSKAPGSALLAARTLPMMAYHCPCLPVGRQH